MNCYENSLYPMIPLGFDVTFDHHGIPYIGCENRILVNERVAESYDQEYGNVQYHYTYTDNDLEDDLRGLDNAIHAERNEQLKELQAQLKELQAHKDLLDRVGYLASKGQMTKEDLRDTQHSIHESLKYGHNNYYRWCDLRPFPKSLVNNDVGTKKLVSICTYLRKTFRVWYVSFQGDRVVMMGSDRDGLDKCLSELRRELAYYAGGNWISHSHGTTHRYERFKARLETELDNINLIAETWGVTEDEAYDRLEKVTQEERLEQEELLLFALEYS